MQNVIADLALIAWPLLAIVLFATQPLSRAVLWTLLGAQMALPAGAFLKIPMVPIFDKTSIPNLCILIGCLISARRPVGFFSRLGLAELLIIAFLVGPILTSQLNSDPVVFGDTVLPGVGLYDAISSLIFSFILLIPLFIGRQFFRTPERSRDILTALSFGGLIYSLPMLFEVRMSPNLQVWIYGFAVGGFEMTIRGGGYRPMVFMGHGLIAAFFMMTAAVAAAALWRARVSLVRLPAAAITGYLGGVLLLCKSFGAAVYGIVLIPLIRWTSPRLQTRVAVVLVSIALLYPALRSFDIFPTQQLLEIVGKFSEQRTGSLKYRFDNEDKLLERAFLRPAFGWGRFGRNRVYNEESGRDESVTDGLWVITIGQFGLVGFLAQFGLLSLGVFRYAMASKFTNSKADAILASAITVIVAASVVELIPNSALMPLTWLMSGALLGRAEALRAEAAQRRLASIPAIRAKAPDMSTRR